MDSSRLDDEHKLIARYAQRLAQEARTVVSLLEQRQICIFLTRVIFFLPAHFFFLLVFFTGITSKIRSANCANENK